MTTGNEAIIKDNRSPAIATGQSLKLQRLVFNIPPGLLVMAGHFLLTCLYTFPLILNFGSRLPGTLLEDRDQNLWNLWWVRDSLLHLRNPFRTDFIYQPEAISLYFHTLHPLNGLISLPVQLLFGMVVAYNFVVFFSFVAAGLGSWLLLKYLCGNGPVAFAASLIFVYAPFHIYTLIGLMQLISLEWLPFYVLFLLKAVRDPQDRWRNSLLAAFFLVCVALIDWYYTLFVLGFTGLYIGWVVVGLLLERWRRKPNSPDEKGAKPDLRPVGLILAGFGILISPVLWPMLRELGSTTYYLPDPHDLKRYAPDGLDYWLPPSLSNGLGWLTRLVGTDATTGHVFLGYTALGLAGLGLVVSRASRFWAWAGTVFWLLSFGPTLKLNGQDTGLPMPYALIQNWPIIKITRSPDRFVVITMLTLAVGAAYGLTWLVGRWRRGLKGRQWWLVGLAVLLITVEFLQIPYPLGDFEVSPFLTGLGQDKADYAILNLPAQNADFPGAARMAEQTVHHKRIFDGYISREYDHPFERRTPGFQELSTLKFDHDIVLPQAGETSRAAWYAALSYYRVRYIVLNLPQNGKQRTNTDLPALRAAIQRVVPDTPIYTDKLIEVYRVPTVGTPQPFVEIGNGWYDPEPDNNTPNTLYHRWASDTANLDLVWQGPNTTTTRLSLKAGVLDGSRAATINLDGAVVWSGELTTAQTIELNLTLTPGLHHLNFGVEGKPVSPKSLGQGQDSRKLLFYVTQVSLT